MTESHAPSLFGAGGEGFARCEADKCSAAEAALPVAGLTARLKVMPLHFSVPEVKVLHGVKRTSAQRLKPRFPLRA